MSEALWLNSNDPTVIYRFARDRASLRKLALLAAGIYRRWDWLPPQCREVVVVIEQCADEHVLAAAVIAATEEVNRTASPPLGLPALRALELLQNAAAGELFGLVTAACDVERRLNRERSQPVRGDDLPGLAEVADVMREVFGNPLRSINFAREWRTSTVVTLARTMYESREYSAMPILADAIQDAGCDNDDILNHCRDTTLSHVRGCWVVDLVLDRV